MPIVNLAFVGWLLTSVPTVAAELPDLNKLDRKITREPAYTCKQPLYGLLAFGPHAEKHVWLVLDKSKVDALGFDVLYLDRNADGNLTAPEKRLVAKSEAQSMVFTLPEFRDPATGLTHTNFRVRASRADTPTVLISLMWQGKKSMGGGYPPESGDYMKLSPRPENAPVIWFQGDGPFRFQRWYGGQLSIGGATDFKVFLGPIGSGPSSFCAFIEHVLPESEAVEATLIYHDQAGEEHREVCSLKERC